MAVAAAAASASCPPNGLRRERPPLGAQSEDGGARERGHEDREGRKKGLGEKRRGGETVEEEEEGKREKTKKPFSCLGTSLRNERRKEGTASAISVIAS